MTIISYTPGCLDSIPAGTRIKVFCPNRISHIYTQGDVLPGHLGRLQERDGPISHYSLDITDKLKPAKEVIPMIDFSMFAAPVPTPPAPVPQRGEMQAFHAVDELAFYPAPPAPVPYPLPPAYPEPFIDFSEFAPLIDLSAFGVAPTPRYPDSPPPVAQGEYRVWPDGTVQDKDDVPHSHMSDDYRIVKAENEEVAAALANPPTVSISQLVDHLTKPPHSVIYDGDMRAVAADIERRSTPAAPYPMPSDDEPPIAAVFEGAEHTPWWGWPTHKPEHSGYYETVQRVTHNGNEMRAFTYYNADKSEFNYDRRLTELVAWRGLTEAGRSFLGM